MRKTSKNMAIHHGLHYIFICAAMGFLSSSAFNIDASNTQIYIGDERDFFGYKVLQFTSGSEKGVMVSAPYQRNGSGGFCRCVQNRTECNTPPETDQTIKYIGLSLADESTSPPKFTACSPGLAHECDGNSYLNSVCYQFNSQLQVTSRFTPAFQECTKKVVDLVFLFDGSKSMTTNEFELNKDFILDIMKSLKNSSIKFAAVQFSSIPRTVFTFKDYQEGRATSNLIKEVHMKELTNTHNAIDFILKNVFDNKIAGATSDATKVLVIITDGNPSDGDTRLKTVIRSDEKNIIRFVIGVKNVKLEKLRTLASAPKESNTFHITDYKGLDSILDKLQNKIFSIEGSKTALTVNLTKEMSQSGFSAVYNEGVLVLGSVGSNNWRGSLYETKGQASEEKEIQDPTLERDSYMGYSVAVGKKKEKLLYFTGAPRSDHKGLMLLFTQQNSIWAVKQRLHGEQIGSYFGAELCALDINSDSNTDFLLVGAPLFHQSQREGSIFVYTLTNELTLEAEMNVSVASQGRFGSSISSVLDLNGDGLRDVAVGAPLENERRGAVYIYQGHQQTGIRHDFSQRITAGAMGSQLQFFGQSIDGKMDLGEDGLTDIVVGARGGVVVLRSRPVLNVSAHLHFHPSQISTDNIDCVRIDDDTFPMVTLTTCFAMAEVTKSKAGALSTGLNVSYMLDVDSVRQRSRAFFSEKKIRRLVSTVELREDLTCFNHSVRMPKCVTDTLSPIIIKLNFSQSESQQEESPTTVLNADSPKQASVEVPFEKHCKRNETCVAELEVDFNFTSQTLLVVDQSYINVRIRLSNHGDDSYNTSLSLHYPPGLSFTKMELQTATRPTLYSCDGPEGEDRTICGVSLPVYRSKSTVTFKSSLYIMSSYDWKDTMEMTIIGLSDNGDSNSSITKTIPVQFAVDLAVKALDEDSITYIQFTAEDAAPKTLVNVYQVKNLGFKAVPVTVTFTLPTELEHKFKIKDFDISVQENQTQCEVITNTTSEYCSPEKQCKSIECDSFTLDKYSTVQFTLSGKAAFSDFEQHIKSISLVNRFTGERPKVKFNNLVQLSYDKQRYVQRSNPGDKLDSTSFHKAQIAVESELIIPPNQQLIIGTGVGGGLLLLILTTFCMLKMGCFKRKRPMEEGEENKSGQCDMEGNTPVQIAPLLGDSQAVHNNVGPPCSSEGEGEEQKEKQDVGEVETNEQDVANAGSEDEC